MIHTRTNVNLANIKKVTAQCRPTFGGAGTLLEQGAEGACLLPGEAHSETLVSYSATRVFFHGSGGQKSDMGLPGLELGRGGVVGCGPFWRRLGKICLLAQDPGLGPVLCFTVLKL